MRGLALRIAARELRGTWSTGLRGFRVFLLCLALGTAAIAAIGTLREGIRAGLQGQGAVILGGDAQMEFTYRGADADELAFMQGVAMRISSVVDFRSMAVTATDQALTQVKAVDDLWPLYGQVELSPQIPLDRALADQDGVPGAVMDPLLIERLGLTIGDRFSLGRQQFRLTASLIREPDVGADGFSLGPRSLVRRAALEGAGLLQPGALFATKYRMELPSGSDLQALQTRAQKAFKDKGVRWRDSRNAAPGIERFVTNLGSFLVLVGLAGLAMGGVGIAAAVRAWLEGRIATIATLKVLGAGTGLIFRIYLLQVALLATLGIAAGLVIGAGVPLIVGPWIEASLPFPASVGISARALAEAAFYGAATVMIFTLVPLARAERVRVAALYREGSGAGRPAAGRLLVLAALVAGVVAVSALSSGLPLLTLGTLGAIAGALAVLALAALMLRGLARRVARGRMLRGRPARRAALAALGAPGSEVTAVMLSLGLGLSVLAAVGQVDWNLRQAIDRDLPERAPAFFFVDIQPDQLAPFLARMDQDKAVTRRDTAPMLRGTIAAINGRPAREVAGDHWVVRGDRGISYAAAMPPGTVLTDGAWWPAEYTGTPLVSFARKEAEEIGLSLGDSITLNVLGREITARVASFREVDFSGAAMGFVMVMNEAALKGAPHSHIATVYAPPEAEAAILRDVTRSWPNITAIRVREAAALASEALSAIATAIAWAASGTLVTGFAVLIGAAAAGQRARDYEAAVLKVMGATRGRILASFALRSGLTGAAAGLIAVAAGGLAAWVVMRFVMEAPFRFEPVSALLVVLGGVLATLVAGLVFAWGPLSARPAGVLRARE